MVVIWSDTVWCNRSYNSSMQFCLFQHQLQVKKNRKKESKSNLQQFTVKNNQYIQRFKISSLISLNAEICLRFFPGKKLFFSIRKMKNDPTLILLIFSPDILGSSSGGSISTIFILHFTQLQGVQQLHNLLVKLFIGVNRKKHKFSNSLFLFKFCSNSPNKLMFFVNYHPII